MLKIEAAELDKVGTVTYEDIPVGSIFTYKEHVDTVPKHGIMYLKCRDGRSVMLNANCGQVEEGACFVNEKFWVVLDATLVIKR